MNDEKVEGSLEVPSAPEPSNGAVEKKPAPKKAKKKSAPKAKPKPKAKKEAAPKEQSKKTSKSHAIKSLGLKLSPVKLRGACNVAGCSGRPANSRTLFCSKHKKEIRKEQLKLNNIVWRKRVAEKKAGHHVVYRGKATEWALTHKEQALKAVKAERSIYDLKEFTVAFNKASAAAKVAQATK